MNEWPASQWLIFELPIFCREDFLANWSTVRRDYTNFIVKTSRGRRQTVNYIRYKKKGGNTLELFGTWELCIENAQMSIAEAQHFNVWENRDGAWCSSQCDPSFKVSESNRQSLRIKGHPLPLGSIMFCISLISYQTLTLAVQDTFLHSSLSSPRFLSKNIQKSHPNSWMPLHQHTYSGSICQEKLCYFVGFFILFSEAASCCLESGCRDVCQFYQWVTWNKLRSFPSMNDWPKNTVPKKNDAWKQKASVNRWLANWNQFKFLLWRAFFLHSCFLFIRTGIFWGFSNGNIPAGSVHSAQWKAVCKLDNICCHNAYCGWGGATVTVYFETWSS